ncbi:MAG: Ig-like domain-containing protein [Gemmatimonadota bacterium]
MTHTIRGIGSSVSSVARTRLHATLAALLLLTSTGCGSDSLGPSFDLDAPVEGDLVVSPVELQLQQGATGSLQLTLRTRDGRELSSFPNSSKVVWSSDRPAIATASNGGAVSARHPGVATITAALGESRAQAVVSVAPRPASLRPLIDKAAEGAVGSALDSIGVRVVDEGGLPVAGMAVQFTVELGGGSVSSPQVLTAADGSAKVIWRLGANPGDNALKVSAGGLPDIFLRAVGKRSGSRSRLEILGGEGQQGEVGALLGSDLAVRVIDENGSATANVGVTWEFVHGAGSAASSQSPTSSALVAAHTDAAGVVRVSWKLGEVSGDQRAVAKLENGYEVWFNARAKPGQPFLVQIEPGAADLGVGQSRRFTATVRDRFGNLTDAQSVSWKAADPSVASINADNGTVVGVASGQTSVEARSGGRTATAQVTVVQSGPSALRIASGAGQSGVAGSPLPQPIVAQVTDAAGQGLPGVSVAWQVARGGGSLSAPVTVTDALGRASVQWTLGAVAGTQQLTVSAGALSPVAVVAIASAGSVAEVRVTPASTSLSPGEERQFLASPVDAAGNPVTGVSVTWTTSNAGVATVSSAGLVLAKAAGDAQIRAAAGGVVGTSSLTVSAPVVSVRITGDSTSLNTLGGALLLGAAAYDANGVKIVTSGANWTSRTPSVASVDQLGRVVARAVGSSVVVACLIGACDSVAVEVRQLVSQVVVSAPSTNLTSGSTVQFSAEARDPGGSPVPFVSFTWASSNPSVLQVDGSGRATAVAPGSAAVVATAHVTSSMALAGPSMTGQKNATVVSSSTPPPPPPPAGGAPELPRTYINTSYQAPTGRRIQVRAGQDLQAAINQAQRGDILALQPGAVFVGNFDLPAKAGSGWIVLTTDMTLPAEGTRVTPTVASAFAKIVSPNTDPALWVRPGASQYRIMGLEVTTDAAAPLSWVTVKLGGSGAMQDALSEVPRDIVLDRMYIHGQPNLHAKRCVEMNASPSAVIDSWLSDCHAEGQDAQAILGWNAPGPFKIVNNYLEGAGENVMFGGADPNIPNLVPSDIEVRHNHLFKPLSWKGSKWTVKNHFELKMGRRVLFEGNVLENNWVHAQSGFSIVMQSLNQGGNAPWAVVEHVTIRYNLIRNSSQGINMLARFQATPALVQNNVLIEHNVLDQIGAASSFGGQGRLFQLLNNVENVTIRNNTGFAGQALMLFDGNTPAPNFVYQNNLTVLGQYGIIGSGKGEGTAALEYYAPGYVFGNNVLVTGKANLYPNGNHFPSNVSQVGFANVSGGNYQLSGSSPYQGTGADIAQFNAKTAGAN